MGGLLLLEEHDELRADAEAVGALQLADGGAKHVDERQEHHVCVLRLDIEAVLVDAREEEGNHLLHYHINYYV